MKLKLTATTAIGPTVHIRWVQCCWRAHLGDVAGTVHKLATCHVSHKCWVEPVHSVYSASGMFSLWSRTTSKFVRVKASKFSVRSHRMKESLNAMHISVFSYVLGSAVYGYVIAWMCGRTLAWQPVDWAPYSRRFFPVCLSTHHPQTDVYRTTDGEWDR